MWDQQAITNHHKAATHMLEIKDLVGKYFSDHPTCTEHQATQYILAQFKLRHLRTKEPPMVAFGSNTNNIHYIAPKTGSRPLLKESLIMLDLWAGIDQPNSPFADVTWMFYHGRNPSKILLETFQHVSSMQHQGIQFIRQSLSQKKLPLGSEIHAFIKQFFNSQVNSGCRNNYTGHCIGFTSPHDRCGDLNQNSTQAIKKNLGYTLEPEIDFPDFGIRLELNFYIDNDHQIILTTPAQKELTLIH